MRLAIVTAVACFSLAGLSAADPARASIKKQTNIPAQALSAALQAFAKDRDLQIVFATEEVKALRTLGAIGELTADEIDELLFNLKATGGTTLVVVTHNIPSAKRLGDALVMLHEGRIVARGTPAELDASQDELVRLFMGSVHGG